MINLALLNVAQIPGFKAYFNFDLIAGDKKPVKNKAGPNIDVLVFLTNVFTLIKTHPNK